MKKLFLFSYNYQGEQGKIVKRAFTRLQMFFLATKELSEKKGVAHSHFQSYFRNSKNFEISVIS